MNWIVIRIGQHQGHCRGLLQSDARLKTISKINHRDCRKKLSSLTDSRSPSKSKLTLAANLKFDCQRRLWARNSKQLLQLTFWRETFVRFFGFDLCCLYFRNIKGSVEASDKTAVCIVLKQRSNSGYYGKLCYLRKQMAVLSDKA